MSEPTQRAECDLSDGSHLEIAWTPASPSQAGGGQTPVAPAGGSGKAPPRSEDVLDAERVDQILALVGQRHAASATAALERTSLSQLAAEA